MIFLASFASSASLEPFRRLEFTAACEAEGATIHASPLPSWWDHHQLDPHYFLFSCDSVSAVKAVATRCVLLRAVYFLLYAAADVPALIERHSHPHEKDLLFCGEREDRFAAEEEEFHYQVETTGRKYTSSEKQRIISALQGTVAHKGRLVWSASATAFTVLIFHSSPSDSEKCALFAVRLTESHRCSLLSTYDLKKRPYIGTTSMPPEESILLANVCRLRPGRVVWDPFCGTGSLLVAAAHFAAHALGSDMDARAMRGGSWKFQQSPQMRQQIKVALRHYSEADLSRLSLEERERPTMWSNFKLYGLRPPDRVRFNFSTWQKGVRSTRAGFLDAILTDPPYGLREPRRKEENTAAHTSSAVYNTTEMTLDLMLFAAEHLAVGGYLAFWYPTSDQYTDAELPSHPALEVLANVPQRLSLKVIRRLVVLRKVRPPPSPRPLRSSLLPTQQGENLRALMDATCLPQNCDYMAYRQRVMRRREATTQFAHTHSLPHDKESLGNRRGRKQKRRQTQEQIVANRERNIRIREEKQILSKIENAKLSKTDGKGGGE